ncbi:hypothetical protein DENIS_3941 [Desulfonema ishimotonii]|uniref:Uncharacterized protein n=1 Tax=Desulfonema ishimotonii TaxID=45657 RepID=A0A401G169_9BACT|nr:type IV secretory system conjugative DNA transfer family protein [Desulfonema ishimotonii]GBC62956.1 hypothetical protein DENIS_3941 [Desulfonema ishimotonii]
MRQPADNIRFRAGLVSVAVLGLLTDYFISTFAAFCVVAGVAGSVMAWFAAGALIDLSCKLADASAAWNRARAERYSVHGGNGFYLSVDQKTGEMATFQRQRKAAPLTRIEADEQTAEAVPVMPQIAESLTLFIAGEQGAGKTTLLSHIAEDRANRGHDVLIIDSHGYDGKYGPFPICGAGRNYGEIDQAFSDLLGEMDERYQRYPDNYKTVSVLIDEFSLLFRKCRNAKEFLESGMTEFRKVGLRLVICTHSLQARYVNMKGGMDMMNGVEKLLLRYAQGERWGELSKYKGHVARCILPGPYVHGSGARHTGTGDLNPNKHRGERERHDNHDRYDAMTPDPCLIPDMNQDLYIFDPDPEPVRRVYESHREKMMVEMYEAGHSLNSIAKAVWGSSNGRRTKQIKGVLTQFKLL